MGSIIDYIDCPKCGNESYNEFYYKSGEEFIFCNHCGYSRNFFIDNWEDKDKKQEDALFEWVPSFKLEEVVGFGCYKIRPKGGIGMEVGTFTQPQLLKIFSILLKVVKMK
jgi:ribosomal protein L37E